MGPTYWCHDLDLSGSRDFLIPRVPFPIAAHCNRVSISNHFGDNGHFVFGPQYLCAHTDRQKHTQTHAASDFIFCPMQCIALDRQ